MLTVETAADDLKNREDILKGSIQCRKQIEEEVLRDGKQRSFLCAFFKPRVMRGK